MNEYEDTTELQEGFITPNLKRTSSVNKMAKYVLEKLTHIQSIAHKQSKREQFFFGTIN